MITEQVPIGTADGTLGFKALYMHNTQAPNGGTVEMRVGRVLVGIQGSEVTREQIMAFAGSIDLPVLSKY